MLFHNITDSQLQAVKVQMDDLNSNSILCINNNNEGGIMESNGIKIEG